MDKCTVPLRLSGGLKLYKLQSMGLARALQGRFDSCEWCYIPKRKTDLKWGEEEERENKDVFFGCNNIELGCNNKNVIRVNMV